MSCTGLALGLSTDSPVRSFYSPYYYEFSSFLVSRLHRDRQKTLFASINGNCLILDSGIGSSLESFPAHNNLPSVSLVDPIASNFVCLVSPFNTARHGFSPYFLSLYNTETLKFLQSQPANSYESIVAQFSLSRHSSTKEVLACLNEIERVLKPGGHFYFIDHSKPESNTFALIQAIINPIYSLFSLGRSLNSPVLSAFSESKFDRLYVEQWPKAVDRQNPRTGITLIYSGQMAPVREKQAQFAPVAGFAPIIAGIGEKANSEGNFYMRNK